MKKASLNVDLTFIACPECGKESAITVCKEKAFDGLAKGACPHFYLFAAAMYAPRKEVTKRAMGLQRYWRVLETERKLKRKPKKAARR